MSSHVRYMVNFQTHFSRYLQGVLPLVVQALFLSFFSGQRNSSQARDESQLFVSAM